MIEGVHWSDFFDLNWVDFDWY